MLNLPTFWHGLFRKKCSFPKKNYFGIYILREVGTMGFSFIHRHFGTCFSGEVGDNGVFNFRRLTWWWNFYRVKNLLTFWHKSFGKKFILLNKVLFVIYSFKGSCENFVLLQKVYFGIFTLRNVGENVAFHYSANFWIFFGVLDLQKNGSSQKISFWSCTSSEVEKN